MEKVDGCGISARSGGGQGRCAYGQSGGPIGFGGCRDGQVRQTGTQLSSKPNGLADALKDLGYQSDTVPYDELLRLGAGIEVDGGEALLGAARSVLGDDPTRERLAAAGRELLRLNRGAAERQADRILELAAR